MDGDIVRPVFFVAPKYGTTAKYAMSAEVGTLVYDIDNGKLSVCVSKEVGSASWEAVTSVAE